MARNVVQFQKGLSEPAFEQQYGTEEQCRAIVIELRWPEGFECPACGGRAHSLVKTRGLFQCSTCRRQTSPIAGTIFAATRSEEHTSELQSHVNLVCRLLLEKKKHKLTTASRRIFTDR